jgi:hypothetical protein
VAKFIAATSPLKKVPDNVANAIDAYAIFKTHGDFREIPNLGPAAPAIVGNLRRAVEGKPLGGNKVGNFAKNILGDPDAVTVDRWMARIFFGKDSVKETQYEFVKAWITKEARKHGVSPRDYQAALWTGKKLEDGLGRGETLEHLDDVIREKIGRSDPSVEALPDWVTE